VYGETIYYGDKVCANCGAELDVDMNAAKFDAYNPVEHIYYNSLVPGKTY
jgi:hypothetical protein